MVDTQQLKKEVSGLCRDTLNWFMKKDFRELDKPLFTETMSNKYNYLYTKSTTLFERCMTGELNTEQLEFMLKMLDKVNNGADYQKTSTEVGQHMVDVYVKPMLDNKQ